VRWGIIGTARIAREAFVPAVAAAGGVVTTVAGRDLARASEYAAQTGIGRAVQGYQALIDDPDVDALYVPLPNALHAEWTIRALRAGKAVLCEKPLASNADEARRMVEAADAAGLPLIEAFHYRYHPVAQLIGGALRSGVLGRPRKLAARLKIRGELMTPDNIRFQPELGGGSTMDLGAYCINLLRMCVGEEPTVTAATPTLLSPEIDIAMHVSLAFPGGAVADFECSHKAERFETWFTLEGEHGSLRCDNPFLPQRGVTVTVEAGGEAGATRFDEPATYVFQARALAKIIRGRAPILTPGADGIANMAVIDAIYRKAGLAPRLTGGPVRELQT
jgi:predicted dehydrogenase